MMILSLKIFWYLLIFVSGVVSECELERADGDTHNIYKCENIVSTFPNVYYGNARLTCDYCIISTFSESTFPSENSLISINVSESGIEYVTANAFSKLGGIQYIYLQNNRISNISEDAFSGLKAIREINLNNNQLEQLSNCFSDLRISYIGISGNRLKEIPPKVFSGVRSLLTLDLSENMINQLHSDSFHSLDSLEALYLNDNLICYIPLGVFRSLSYLRYLNLAGNKLSKFSVGAFSGLKNLDYLNLSNNSIIVFEGDMLLPMGKLYTLDISNNSIYYFDAHLIHTNAPSIRILQMENNLFSCKILMNIVQYFRKVGIEVYSPEGTFDVQNINGVACTDVEIFEPIPFDRFYNYALRDTRSKRVYC